VLDDVCNKKEHQFSGSSVEHWSNLKYNKYLSEISYILDIGAM
jgi:hypothetical protein